MNSSNSLVTATSRTELTIDERQTRVLGYAPLHPTYVYLASLRFTIPLFSTTTAVTRAELRRRGCRCGRLLRR